MVGAGALGMLLMLAAWHLYTDHATFHQLINAINANAATAVTQAPSAPQNLQVRPSEDAPPLTAPLPPTAP